MVQDHVDVLAEPPRIDRLSTAQADQEALEKYRAVPDRALPWLIGLNRRV